MKSLEETNIPSVTFFSSTRLKLQKYTSHSKTKHTMLQTSGILFAPSYYMIHVGRFDVRKIHYVSVCSQCLGILFMFAVSSPSSFHVLLGLGLVRRPLRLLRLELVP